MLEIDHVRQEPFSLIKGVGERASERGRGTDLVQKHLDGVNLSKSPGALCSKKPGLNLTKSPCRVCRTKY